MDPSAQANWTSALREKSRSELDSNAVDNDPYSLLAEKFSDYQRYVYQNACVLPTELDPITRTPLRDAGTS